MLVKHDSVAGAFPVDTLFNGEVGVSPPMEQLLLLPDEKPLKLAKSNRGRR